MKTKTYTIYLDPGHGWLKATRIEVINLGIAKRISHCSYQRKSSVYLEEDFDAYKFIKAKEARGYTLKFKELHTDRSSKIRSYDPYTY